MSNAYKVLPPVYDRWQQAYGKDFTSLIFPRLLSTIRFYKIRKAAMLDLACGTGTLALLMARRGWQVWGVDGSEGMLAEALNKVRNASLPVKFLCQDMRGLEIPEQVSLVTSLFDSVNHIVSRKDLLRVLRAVHKCLLPGGFFVFDVNNELCFKTLWQRTDAVHHKEFTLIFENTYNAIRRMASSNVTLFLKDGESYKRQNESVRERYYPDAEIAGLLKRAKFEVLQREDFTFTTVPHIGKIKTWWVARKPATM